MKKIYENDEEFNFIGAISRELTGYDPDNLLKEMEDAERQWKKEQQEHPEEAKAVMQKAETDFKKLMECIRKTESVVETSHGNKREECLEEIYKETADATEILEKVCVTADGAVKRPEAARKAIAEAAERPDAACKAVEEAAKRTVAACKVVEEAVERSVAVCKDAAEAEERSAAAYKGMAEAEERLRAAHNPVAEAAEQPEKFCEMAVRATEISDKLHKTIAGQATDGAGDEGCIRAEMDGEGYTGSKADGEGYAGSTRAKLSDERSITDIPDKTYPEQHRTIAKPEYKMPIPIGKKTLRKVAILTTAAMILGVGGMASVARQGYRMAEYPEQYGGDQRTIVRNNVHISFPESEIEEAYRQIGEVCNIKAIAFDYIPEEMELDEVIISPNKGIIKLCYGNKRVYLEQKVLKRKNTVSVLTMDRKRENVIQNDWLDQELYLEENLLESGSVEYSIQFDTSSASYYLSGMIGKDEFVQIVENLYFWN